MVEGVISRQAFCLGSSEERVITAHEGDGVLVARQELAATGLITLCIPRLNELTDPGTAWLRDIVLDHGASIKVVDGHN